MFSKALAHERIKALTNQVLDAEKRLKEAPGYNAALRIQMLQRHRKQLQAGIKPELAYGRIHEDPTQDTDRH